MLNANRTTFIIMHTFESYLNLPTLVYKTLFKQVLPVHQCVGFKTEFVNCYVNSKHYSRFSKMFKSAAEVPSFAFIPIFKSLTQTLAISPIPSKLLGLVHIEFSIKANSKVNWFLPFTTMHTIENVNESAKGILYRVSTDIFQSGKKVASLENAFLAKDNSYKNTAQKKFEENEFTHIFDYKVSQLTALKYALASGDFNPIHLSKPTAKLFGLPNSIMHGMYHIHKVLSSESIMYKQDKDLVCKFNKPCYLPSNIKVVKIGEGEYAVESAKKSTRHVTLTFDNE